MPESLKISSNGQWELVKWDDEQKKVAAEWMESGNRKNLKKLPPLTGKDRDKMTSILETATASRINPKTQDKEFLLHRAHSREDPFSTPAGNLGIEGEKPNPSKSLLSSWTTDKNFANYWAGLEEDKNKKVTSAWVPHHQIHSIMHPEMHGEDKDEGEVLVHPEPGTYR